MAGSGAPFSTMGCDHGGDEYKEGGTAVSFFEGFAAAPGVEMFLLLPGCEIYVVAKFICGC
jgi:hypothetical protein